MLIISIITGLQTWNTLKLVAKIFLKLELSLTMFSPLKNKKQRILRWNCLQVHNPKSLLCLYNTEAVTIVSFFTTQYTHDGRFLNRIQL